MQLGGDLEKTVRSTYSISMLNTYLFIDCYSHSFNFLIFGIKVKFFGEINVIVVISDEQELNRICIHEVSISVLSGNIFPNNVIY